MQPSHSPRLRTIYSPAHALTATILGHAFSLGASLQQSEITAGDLRVPHRFLAQPGELKMGGSHRVKHQPTPLWGKQFTSASPRINLTWLLVGHLQPIRMPRRALSELLNCASGNVLHHREAAGSPGQVSPEMYEVPLRLGRASPAWSAKTVYAAVPFTS